MFQPGWRNQALGRLADPFDLVIIGGGISGCGIFLDASQRGLATLLLERADLAAGTSSRSSKMIHGGLRYLKELQLKTTFHASRERDRMLALNPELVRPIRFLYPSHRGDKVPNWMLEVGLWMYDRMTTPGARHGEISIAEAARLAPGLETGALSHVFAYTDAMTDDALLTWSVAATGMAYGGTAITRAEVLGVTPPAAGRRGIRFRDLESGAERTAHAHVVVNAAGVWVDEVRARLGFAGRRLRPSRGSHLVVSRERLPITAALTIPSPDDGRPVFLVPHPEGVLIGTTDLFHDGPLDDPRPRRAEVDYLLRALAAQFPERALTGRDVVAAFAGLRPILSSHEKDPSEVSRDEEIWEEDGIVSAAGGKLTTWRLMAEEVVDRVVAMLPDDLAARAAPCRTAGTPLVGLAPSDFGSRLARAGVLSPGLAAAAARRLTARALWLPRLARDETELHPLVAGSDLCAAEVRAHLAYGGVVRLEDLLVRRVRLALWEPALADDLLPKLRTIVCEELGWEPARWEREVEATRRAFEAWSPTGVRG